MKKIYCYFLFLLLFSGCRSVSLEQRNLVRQFADKTDHFSVFPATIWSELAAIRESRGIFYANSFNDPFLHQKELDAIVQERLNDDWLSGRATSLFQILDLYAAGLTSLSSDAPFKTRSGLFTRWGDDMEELIAANNQLNPNLPLPSGSGKLLVSILESSSRHWLAKRQMKALRQYVMEADTLVSAVCLSMEKYLSSELFVRLIQNEESGITESFRFYFAKRSPPALESERAYVALKKRIATVEQLRMKSLVAIKNLAKAHQMLVLSVNRKPSVTELTKALKDYYKEVESLRQLVKKVNL